MKYFKKIFKEENNGRPVFTNVGFNTISRDQGDFLVAKFTHEEIDSAMESCDASKALGPDGFNFNFVKEAWGVIKDDMYRIVEDF